MAKLSTASHPARTGRACNWTALLTLTTLLAVASTGLASAVLPQEPTPASPGSRGDASSERRLLGSWFTGLEDSGPLEALFSASGEHTWSVVFRFDFQGQPRTFSGSAEGEIGRGALSGRVTNEDGRREFTFSGVFEDGVFRGQHSEIEYGVAEPTGTLVLSEEDSGSEPSGSEPSADS